LGNGIVMQCHFVIRWKVGGGQFTTDNESSAGGINIFVFSFSTI